MNIALITGASSGLGREFLKQLAERDLKNRIRNQKRKEMGLEPDQQLIDQFWVVARRKERLEELQELTDIPVVPFPLDLKEKESALKLKEAMEKENPTILYLICAAGFGRIGPATSIPIEDNDGMIDVNCRAAVDVTTVSFPYLQKGSKVIQICSTAGFQAMPNLAVYSASKSFLITYTKTLHHELLTKGIHVTAVCPYWIKDTEFIGNAEKTDSKGYNHYLFASKARNVVSWALFDSKINMWVSTPGPVCMVHRVFAKFVPHFVMTPLMELVRRV